MRARHSAPSMATWPNGSGTVRIVATRPVSAGAAPHGQAVCSDRLHDEQPGDPEADQRDDDASRYHHAGGGAGARERQDHPGREGRNRRGAQRPVGGHMGFRDQEHGTEQQEDYAEHRHPPRRLG